VASGLPQAGEVGWGGGDGQFHGTPLPESRLPSGWFAVSLPLTGPGYREQAKAGDGRSVSGLLVADRRQATRRVPTLHHGQQRAQPAATRMAAARVVRRLGVPPPRRPMPVGTRRADQQQRACKQVCEQCHKQQDEG
jgi:hypothetical protein